MHSCVLIFIIFIQTLHIFLQPRPLIMWNPRLYSKDVGVGYNVRQLRQYFLRYAFQAISFEKTLDMFSFKLQMHVWVDYSFSTVNQVHDGIIYFLNLRQSYIFFCYFFSFRTIIHLFTSF